ncbi:MAG: 16S rRNA processing protein RimM [Alphaproteobacteria bacterium]|nr:16S rRNA processing protein RimM [Alphaproteobacteria bacterium]
MTVNRKICVGQFAGAHGVRGLVKLRSFAGEPEAIFGYAPLLLEDGREVKIGLKSQAKDHFLVAVEGVGDKEAADALRGDKVFIPRNVLPEIGKDEYYDADLIGLMAADEAGHDYGRVLAVHDYGAGAFLEIGASKKNSFMLPFKNPFVPEVDVKGGKVTVAVPEGWLKE